MGRIKAHLLLVTQLLMAADSLRISTETSLLAGKKHACNVDDSTLTLENQPTNPTSIDPTLVDQRTGDVEDWSWVHVSSFFFSDSADSRNTEPMLGSPGGDLGSFILALDVFNKSGGSWNSTISSPTSALQRVLATTGKVRFFYSTSEDAHNAVIDAMAIPDLDIANPPAGAHQKLLELLVDPAMVGMPTVKAMLENPDSYGVSKDSVQSGIVAFFQALWDRSSAGRDKLAYVSFQGANAPRAAVKIKLPTYCVAQGLAPLYITQLNFVQVVVSHQADVVAIFHEQLAGILAEGKSDMITKMTASMAQVYEKFEDTTAAGMPLGLAQYAVTASSKKKRIVEEIRSAPAPAQAAPAVNPSNSSSN